MSVLRTQRKRLELLLTFLVGLIGGICLSQLMQQQRDSHDYATNHMPRNSKRCAAATTTTTSTSAAAAANESRVLCLIMTTPRTHFTHARHIKNTWGKRCNGLLFMSTKLDKRLGTVVLPVKPGNSNLWGKTREAWRYVHEHHLQDYDWFLKADDDTYVIMENLRELLQAQAPKTPIYLGSRSRLHSQQRSVPVGAGYVLSKTALQQFINRAYDNASLCNAHSFGLEHIEITRCLQNAGVRAVDTRDNHRWERFLAFGPYSNKTQDCCSDDAVSLRYNKPAEFYVLEYLIYRLRPFGLDLPMQQLTQHIPQQVV